MLDMVSENYKAEAGKCYAQRQGEADSYGFKFQSEFFRPFVSARDVVLDFGCGKGGIARHLRCAQIDGFDVNPHVLGPASEVFDTVFSDYADVPAAFYNVVYSNHVLEHVLSPLEVLMAVRSWLKPGGRAVFIVPHDCLRDRSQRNAVSSDPDHHLFTWTPRSLANLFVEAGLGVLKSKILASAWHPRLFWLHALPVVGGLSRRMLCLLLHRHQIICVGERTL